MKQNLQFLKITMLAAVIFIINSAASYSQDEVIVDPGFQTLQTALNDNPGKTLVLKRGGTYVVDARLELNEPTIIRGETEPAEDAPAVIQMFANPGEGWGKKLISFGANSTIKDVGLMGYTTDAQILEKLLLVTGEDVEVVIDGCVIQGAYRVFNHSGQNNNHYTLKNNIIFNIVNNGWDNYGGYGGALWGGDSVTYESINNTFFVVGRLLGNAGSVNRSLQKHDHNSYIVTWGDPFFPIDDNVILTNNIFYDAQVRGYVGVRNHPTADTVMWEGDYADWEHDTLCGMVPVNPHELDTLEERTVNISHNMMMYSDYVLDFYEQNNVTKQPFLAEHVGIFGNDLNWTLGPNYLQEVDEEVDPQFEMETIPAEAYEMMFKNRLNRHLPVSMREEGFPFQNAYRPNDAARSDFIWPLPFQFKPTNTEIWNMGSDGYPLGDLNWFGDEVVAAWEAGEDNPLATGIKKHSYGAILNLKTYPNPFSGSVEISYLLPARSKVKVTVYNTLGSEVALLADEVQTEGFHSLNWDSGNLPSGIYFCEIKTNNMSQFKKMIRD